MPTAPRKPVDRSETSPPTRTTPPTRTIPTTPPTRTIGFGLMLVIWWILTIELPGRLLSKLLERPDIDVHLRPLTVWTYELTQAWMSYRWLAVILIIIAIGVHNLLWLKYPLFDSHRKRLFKVGFLIFYIILYAFFLLLFLGAEIPIWTWPSELSSTIETQ